MVLTTGDHRHAKFHGAILRRINAEGIKRLPKPTFAYAGADLSRRMGGGGRFGMREEGFREGDRNPRETIANESAKAGAANDIQVGN